MASDRTRQRICTLDRRYQLKRWPELYKWRIPVRGRPIRFRFLSTDFDLPCLFYRNREPSGRDNSTRLYPKPSATGAPENAKHVLHKPASTVGKEHTSTPRDWLDAALQATRQPALRARHAPVAK